MRKLIIALLSVLLTMLFFGCDDTIAGETFSINVPPMPASLSGNTDDAVANRYSSIRSTFDFDTLFAMYNSFIIVPEIAYNYNSYIDTVLPIIENSYNGEAAGGLEWTNISDGDFTNKFETADSDMIGFTNDDLSIVEMYQNNLNGEGCHLMHEEKDGQIHSVLLMYHAGGKMSHDSVEIIETENNIYTKCLRIHWMDTNSNLITTPIANETPPYHNLQHFVAITDKTSPDGKTTGLRNNDFAENTQTARDAFTSYSGGYLPQEDLNNNNQGYIGYFNNVDLYDDSTDSDFDIQEYKTISDIEFLFEQGLNIEDIYNMDLGTDSEGGLPFQPWNFSLLE